VTDVRIHDVSAPLPSRLLAGGKSRRDATLADPVCIPHITEFVFSLRSLSLHTFQLRSASSFCRSCERGREPSLRSSLSLWAISFRLERNFTFLSGPFSEGRTCQSPCCPEAKAPSAPRHHCTSTSFLSCFERPEDRAQTPALPLPAETLPLAFPPVFPLHSQPGRNTKPLPTPSFFRAELARAPPSPFPCSSDPPRPAGPPIPSLPRSLHEQDCTPLCVFPLLSF